MCPRMTHHQWGAAEACACRVASAGALAFANAGAGAAGLPAHALAFAARQLGLARLRRVLSREVSRAHLPTQACAACVGIDWAATSHAVCRPAAGSETRASRVWAHTPEAIRAWAAARRHRCGGPPMAVGRDGPPGPLVAALRAPDCWVLFPVPALTGATYRDAFTPRRATDAPSEAARQLDRLGQQREPLQTLRPQRATRRRLDPRLACRRRRGEAKGRLTHRLTSALQHDGPHGWHWVADHDTTPPGPPAQPSISPAVPPWSASCASPLCTHGSW